MRKGSSFKGQRREKYEYGSYGFVSCFVHLCDLTYELCEVVVGPVCGPRSCVRIHVHLVLLDKFKAIFWIYELGTGFPKTKYAGLFLNYKRFLGYSVMIMR